MLVRIASPSGGGVYNSHKARFTAYLCNSNVQQIKYHTGHERNPENLISAFTRFNTHKTIITGLIKSSSLMQQALLLIMDQGRSILLV